MFMVEVNLKSMDGKRYDIPPKIRFRLEQILLKIEVLADYFHYMVQKHNDGKNKKYSQDMEIAKLFYNITTWPRPPDKFNTDLLNRTRIYSPKQLKKIYGKWKRYHNNVNDFAKSKPSPKESDECIQLLARNSISRELTDCRIPGHCEKILYEGSEYGYGLSHRLLFMAIARFSRNCIVFTEKVDQINTDKYCRRSFSEAQYIALNGFKLPDLMYEHITLCSLFGHAQFFRNSWIRRLLQFQTLEGCFSDKIAIGEFDADLLREGDNDEWKITNPEDIMNGQCNGHFTAVAAATLSSVLRYIFETYH
ncbi:hypothetical protein PYW07_014797 [Mythimna separata]|uniref:Uncharacterized protein n=1 Tax=Mythimna separata TaxID=271217 RepID=A0AAD8E0G8_MYTSE|nr:hypothetical protein PYW07_014797 [Mythimna separata]